ncbi:site-specific DNA-methyltransferase [Methanococcus maripaludis]|uniref:Adenine-specific DNA-methyltransferase n=3 Tax=Methanococcus maripaludis TaxID=39152 RepID=A0A7J9PGF0_METMI|nr:site-specific DNA-methyltransferase [Methanococcus maripaludis]MBA2861826.1 adenine-specific DNA-methyltransferase [Methanococcus maripaludis]
MVNNDKLTQMQAVLRNLFQFEESDLDFGIYRIINIKRNEIKKFIEEDLINIIQLQMKSVEDTKEIEKKIDELKSQLEGVFGKKIDAIVKLHGDTDGVKNYLGLQKLLNQSKNENSIEEGIYEDIINFFSRYYDSGDFISKRRYSKSNKYAIPYNGEEVYLYWANNDQYYIKTSENFLNYSFKLGSLSVNFEISSEDTEVEQNNVKSSDKKFFIFNNLEYNQDSKELTVTFGYRGLTKDEENEVNKISGKKTVTNDTVNEFNVEKITEQIGIYGISSLFKKHLKMDGTMSDKSEIEWHLNKYATKNTSDYFIHKDLKKFLTGELDFYIKNEMFHLDNVLEDNWNKYDIELRRIKVFKEISLNIIDFLAQVENFQKKLWEKKKFVVSTDYCITLDRIDKKHYSKILSNHSQLDEWKTLFDFDVNVKTKDSKSNLLGYTSTGNPEIELLVQNPTLTLDTKFFDEDFKYELLSEIDNLEDNITGILINSENFQALNLLLEKYREKIKCCYIDPPYNKGYDGFIYKDNFKHSSWNSLIYDRLALSKNLIRENGSISISIDDDEEHNLTALADMCLGNENRLAKLIWNRNHSAQAGFFKLYHEYVLCYSKNRTQFNAILGADGKIIAGAQKKESKRHKLQEFTFPKGTRFEAEDGFELNGTWGGVESTELINGRMMCKGNKLAEDVTLKAGWTQLNQMNKYFYSDEEVFDTKNQKVLEFFFSSTGKLKYVKEKTHEIPSTVLNEMGTAGQASNDLTNILGYSIDSTPKSIKLMEFIINYLADESSLVLDFFAGSGTTGHAVINLNKEDNGKRKFILVEMGQYFDTVLKPRIQKAIYSENWKDGKPLDNNGSTNQIIKYHKLEQYEDTLNNIEFKIPTLTALESKDYAIKYMLEFESRDNNVFLNLDNLDNPFNYILKIEQNNEIKEQKIDLIETFNYIAGITVNKIYKTNSDNVSYVVVSGKRNGNSVIVIWRNKDDKFDPTADKDFVENNILTEQVDEIFMNGNSLVTNAKPLDEVFKANMFGD